MDSLQPCISLQFFFFRLVIFASHCPCSQPHLDRETDSVFLISKLCPEHAMGLSLKTHYCEQNETRQGEMFLNESWGKGLGWKTPLPHSAVGNG